MSFVRDALARGLEKDSEAPKVYNKCWLLAAMFLAAALAFGPLFGDKTESRAAALAPHCTKWPLGALSLPKHFAVGLKTPSLEHSLASRSRSHEPQFADGLFDLYLLCALIAAIGSRKTLVHWPLFALSLTLLPLATALNCSIDLSLFDEYDTVQCDAVCDSCQFVLNNGSFKHGTLQCSSNMPCSLESFGEMTFSTINGALNSTLSVELFENADMDYSTVNGQLASALSVKVHTGDYPFFETSFHAPNGGNFVFEATNTQIPLSKTSFHAENSKVVDISIYDDHLDNYPEILSMFVYASNADELNIFVGANTRYAQYYDSTIECPSSGLCQWKSFGKRFDGNHMSVVKVDVFPDTDLRVLCANSAEACDGIVVNCQTDNCTMQFNTEADTWNCESTCDNVYSETISMTTTPQPTRTTTPMPTVTNTEADTTTTTLKPATTTTPKPDTTTTTLKPTTTTPKTDTTSTLKPTTLKPDTTTSTLKPSTTTPKPDTTWTLKPSTTSLKMSTSTNSPESDSQSDGSSLLVALSLGALVAAFY